MSFSAPSSAHREGSAAAEIEHVARLGEHTSATCRYWASNVQRLVDQGPATRSAPPHNACLVGLSTACRAPGPPRSQRSAAPSAAWSWPWSRQTLISGPARVCNTTSRSHGRSRSRHVHDREDGLLLRLGVAYAQPACRPSRPTGTRLCRRRLRAAAARGNGIPSPARPRPAAAPAARTSTSPTMQT